ncbi:MAG TPA: gluconokinase [Agriterribacter sp.]|nr:gluconokinase [Agriterribacter sp.]
MSIIIGADIGTSNIKVIAFKKDNEVLLSMKAPCPTLTPSYERMEQDPKLMLELINQLLKKVLVQLKDEEIAGICFSTAMHSIMAVDKNHLPLTNAILWGDTRSAPQCELLKKMGRNELLYPNIGVPLHPSLPLCKIIWLKENAPELFAGTYKFISLKEYFFFQWFGKYIIDHSIAGATGLQDIHHLRWNPTAIQTAGISENQLSQIVPVTHAETQLTAAYRDYFGINDIPFIVGSSDGCLANTGSGVIQPYEAALTIGTSGAVRTTVTTPALREPALFCYPFAKNTYIKGGAVNNGGNVLNWFAECFLQQSIPTEKDYSNLVQQAHSVDAGANGLLFLPYIQGERAPVWNAAARGVFFGIHPLHRQAHFARAVLEGICYGLYDIFCLLNANSDPITTLYASGGFTQDERWVQLIADLFNKKVQVSNQEDASATGAALLGRYATGQSKSFSLSTTVMHSGKSLYPDKEKHQIYMRYFSVYRSLYSALEQEFPKLVSL